MTLFPAEQLPAPSGPILGRDQLIDHVVDLLTVENARLLTLTGPGGIGKTRLAIAISECLVQKLRKQVTLVALESVREPAAMPAALARSVGVLDKSGDTEADLIRWLSDQERVIVLDNFEQIMGAVPLLSRLLAACPGIRFLVTSRFAPLHLAGERVVNVGPLDFPPISGDLTRIDPARYPAIQYFLQNAPSVTWSESSRAVIRICQRLDGIPLALELAAARIGLLSVDEVADQTTGWMDILTQGRVDAPARHQTMARTIAWSYQLLTSELQRVFRGLGVFAGDFRREAAVEVTNATPGQLTSLLESRLVIVSTSQTRTPCFRLREPVRDFANQEAERLDEVPQMQQAFAHWAISYVRQVNRTPFASQIFTNEGQMLEKMLQSERANLIRALSWMIENNQLSGCLTIASVMSDYWYISLRPGEGLPWLSSVLKLAQEAGASYSQEYVKVALGHALLSQVAGANAEALDMTEHALEIARSADDVTAVGESMGVLGYVTLNRGEYERSMEAGLAALEIFRTPEFEDKPWQVDILDNLALAAVHLGDLEQAGRYAEQAVAIAGAVNSSFGYATSLRALGDVRAHQGRFMKSIQAHTDAFAAGVLRYGRSGPETWHNISQGMAGAALIAWYALPDDPGLAEGIVRKTERICHMLGTSKPDNRISYQIIRDQMKAAGKLQNAPAPGVTAPLSLEKSLAELRSLGFEIRRRLFPDEVVFPRIDPGLAFLVDPETPNVLTASISPAQLSTIRSIVNGKSVKEIAIQDGVNQSSVYHRIDVVREKWGLPKHATLLDLAVFAVRHGVA